MRKEVWILGGILVFLIGIGFLFVKSGGEIQAPVKSVDNSMLIRDTIHSTGSNAAKVTVVEFGDYQCPACGAAEPALEQLINTYKGNPNFNFVFRNYPLPMHPNAPAAAEAAEAAGAQGKFWEMHNKLYQAQNEWAGDGDPLNNFFIGYAKSLGLNVDQFKADVLAKKYANVIRRDQDDGNDLEINATPTFFINGAKNVGVLDFITLKNMVEMQLKK